MKITKENLNSILRKQQSGMVMTERENKIANIPLYKLYGFRTVTECVNVIIRNYKFNI